MDRDVVIRAEGLGKKYVLGRSAQSGRYTALRDVVADAVKAPLRRFRHGRATQTEKGDDEFWALRDVNFEVKRGEVVGVIGRNGAGKSTLLKVLSRVTEPTTGRVSLRGRVASLLEVGTGFHPELTGRENIFLNGAILGMQRTEIKAKFDEIVAFAEVERFLDTPVKRYSSGMYVRLAFAVAAHLEPEILIIDEVLAVGDAEFQKKCLGKMQDVAKQGRTVLFVSHNMEAIERLTSRGVLLKSGQLMLDGPTGEVVTQYLQQSAVAVSDLSRFRSTSAPGEATFEQFWTESLSGERGTAFRQGEPFKIGVQVRLPKPGLCDLSVVIENSREQSLFTTHLGDSAQPLATSGVHRFTLELTTPLLRRGQYGISAAAFSPDKTQFFDVVVHLPLFEIAGTSNPSFPDDARWGDLYLPIGWTNTSLAA